jgi:hypothetical protein
MLTPGADMIRMTAAVLAVTLAVSTGLAAQGTTNFAGTWNVDAAKSDPSVSGRAGVATTKLVITQTAAEMTVITTTARGEAKTVYKLDGSEMVEAGAMADSKAKASWQGGKLVINRIQTLKSGAGTLNSKEVYSLEGGALTLVTSRTSPAGETSRKTVFTKG